MVPGELRKHGRLYVNIEYDQEFTGSIKKVTIQDPDDPTHDVNDWFYYDIVEEAVYELKHKRHCEKCVHLQPGWCQTAICKKHSSIKFFMEDDNWGQDAIHCHDYEVKK